MASIVSVFNMKGGTGRSTVTGSLGYICAMAGKRVLLVDLDHSASLTYMYNEPSSVLLGRTVFDAFVQRENLPVIQLRERLFMVPGSPSVVSLEKMCLGSQGAGLVLENLLSGVVDDYDIVLIDCPSKPCLLLDNALSVCTGILIPVLPDQLSYYGVLMSQNYMREVRIDEVPPMRILINAFCSRYRSSASFVSFMKGQFGEAVLDHMVRRTVLFPDSLLRLSPVPETFADSFGASDLLEVYDELSEKLFVKLNK